MLRGEMAKVLGIDVDGRARDNPSLDGFRLIESRASPVEDGSIDVIVCDSVLEHVQEVASFFSGARRVMKCGAFRYPVAEPVELYRVGGDAHPQPLSRGCSR
jgi:ubiquinone/menaquinone biosynthesis C-methylase UbiE